MPAVLSTSGKNLTASTSVEEVMSVAGATKMKNKKYYRVKIKPHFNYNFS